jgi:hypothetical protein
VSADGPTGRDFGRLEAQVDALDSKFDTLSSKIDTLTAKLEELQHLAERGKGAYWGALGLASTVGAVVAWAVKTFSGKVPTP